MIYDFDLKDQKANDFGKLLIENWGKEFGTEIKEKFKLIEDEVLLPEFSIPENDDELKEFVGIQMVPISLIIGKNHCFNLDLFSFGTSNALFNVGYAYKF